MRVYRFDGLFTEDGWHEPGWVRLDEAGRVLCLGAAQPEDEVIPVKGYALPGFQNAHSHAFQFAMAGIAERLSSKSDDFWSWREAMYNLALTISPDEMEAIATMLYSEMLRHGYTSVAEFHYLHHDPQGQHYANLAEMGARLVAAAQKTGIRLTLVPVFYQTGDFGKPAFEKQRRFLSPDLETWSRLLEASAHAVAAYDGARLGGGLHSLRAALPEDVPRVFAAVPKDAPRHIHIAEQMKEVATCQAVTGKRPVEWLMANVDIDASYHLVHATHLTQNEMHAIVASGATVVLCPSTEGNLGDGFFPLREYLSAKGSWAIGTDSHIGLSPMEELRWLDYGQRLGMQKRNVLCLTTGEDSGDLAFRQSFLGGSRSMGANTRSFFEPGRSFDAVVLDADYPLLTECSADHRLATLLYGADVTALLGTITGGEWVVRDGRHMQRQSIAAEFRAALQRLANR